MARKSRKNLPVAMGDPVDSLMAQTAGKLNFEVTSYHAAIYARLSCETEANRERDTVETQIAYLRNFIDRRIWNWQTFMQMFRSAAQTLNGRSLNA